LDKKKDSGLAVTEMKLYDKPLDEKLFTNNGALLVGAR
jgi:hypothetical protein